ncbi:hypothetical protein [Bradyrhizobium canariense]|uniref:hypothetical protein n=1 Tax=Bradyrhizobium canariense TaxID=255045 RepID=UPI002011B10A|nr:hypothetical protein [Bradyrhizobium canariense]
MDCRSVQQDGSNEREINRKGCRPGALCGPLPSKLDQFLAGDVFELHAPEGCLERFKDHGLRPSNRLADLSKIVEMQRDQVGKDTRLLIWPRAPDGSAPID